VALFAGCCSSPDNGRSSGNPTLQPKTAFSRLPPTVDPEGQQGVSRAVGRRAICDRSSSTGVGSGRTGVRAKADIPLRARKRPHSKAVAVAPSHPSSVHSPTDLGDQCDPRPSWSRELQALGHTVRLMPPAYASDRRTMLPTLRRSARRSPGPTCGSWRPRRRSNRAA
jgi:hypothetical protein